MCLCYQGDGDRVESFNKLELEHLKLDERNKYAPATLVMLLDFIAGASDRIAIDMKYNRFVNMSGKVDGNQGHVCF